MKVKLFLQNNQLLLITIISVFSLIFFQALFVSLNIEYRPHNGNFQTFNPLRRIFAGELPGRDFNPYLGLGVTYLNAVTTYFLGGSFAASKFSTYFLSVILHFLALVTLFFLVGFQLKRAIIAAAFPLITIYLDRNKIIPIWKLIEPSNSNLSLRSSLPFITVFFLFLLLKFCRKYPRLFYVFSGCLIAIQPFWSNDYGIPSCLTLVAVIIFDLIKQKKDHKISKIIYLFTSTFVFFTLLAYILTGGNPVNWIKDNFGGVASDQFWYYLWFNGSNKIFELNSILSHPFLVLYFLTILLITIYLLFQEYTIKQLSLFYLALTVFGAGIISSVGGTISFRYYLTTIVVSLFIYPLLFYKIWLLIKQKNNYLAFNVNNIFTNLHIFLKFYYPIVTIISIIISQSFFSIFLGNQHFFFVKELGGWLPSRWYKSIVIARNIKEELTNISPTQRILSTYSSGMDVVAGAFNPTGIDYIIHALGNETRDKYLKRYQEAKPRYITTLREDLTKWETWVRRTNWWFYREFFQEYEPVAATFYNIIWRRRENPRNPNDSPVSCTIDVTNNEQTNLIINTELQKNKQSIYYLEVTLNYFLEVESTGVPILGKRGLVNAIANQTALSHEIGQNNNRRYGMPPGSNKWYMLIEHSLENSSILILKSYPENRSKLTIKSCQAKLIAPVDDFGVNRQISSANVTNSNWQNGIYHHNNNSRAGFIIDDRETLSEIYIGTEVEFAQSGNRKIIDIEDNKIWVNGSSLDSLADGYPHPIIIKLR